MSASGIFPKPLFPLRIVDIVKILSDKRKDILILHPILSNYEVIGSIVVLKDSIDTKPTDFECKMVKHTAELLGKQLENE